MKIYFVANGIMPNKKAYGIHIAKMCEAFSERGFDVTLVIPWTHSSSMSIAEFYGLRKAIPTLVLPSLGWYGKGKKCFILSSLSFMLTSGLYLWFKKMQGSTSLIYTVDLSTFSFGLLPLSGLPVYAEMHNVKPDTFLCRFFFRYARGIIFTNGEIQEELIRRFHIPKGKCIVEPNGVDDSWFVQRPKSKARAQLNLPLKEKIALYVGRFYAWKGLEILPRAFKERDIQCYVVGGTQEEFKQITNASLPANVHFVGGVPQEKIPEWLAAADTLIVLGTKANEESYRFTAPMKVFEYMAAARPVVASATPALKCFIPTDTVSWYEPDNPVSLAETVQKTIHSDTKELVARAQELAKRHTWGMRASRIGSFFTSSQERLAS